MLTNTPQMTLNDVISSFYEAAMGNISWQAPLGLAAELLNASNAVFSVRDPITRKAHFSFGNFGTNETFVRNFAETYAILSPFVISSAVSAEGEAVNPINLIGREEYEEGRFYKEWSQPQGYHDYIGSVLVRQPQAVYTIAFGRTTDRPLFTDADLAKLEQLAPHVTRALHISGRLNTLETEKAELLATLDSLAAPVILVDNSATIRQINTAGVELLEQQRGVLNLQGRLKFSNPSQESEFRSSFSLIEKQPLLMKSKLENGMRVHLVPRQLQKNRDYASARDERMLALFDHPEPSIKPIGAQLRDRFGFTVAELRVMLLLLDGHTMNDISKNLGLALPTIKTHVQNLFDKTNTHRQSDLVRTVMSLNQAVSPIRTPLLINN